MTTKEQIKKLDAMAKPRSEEAVKKAEERKKRRRDIDQLLKDLCARLLYGVMVRDDMGRVYKLEIGNSYLIDLYYGNGDYVEVPIKPYLRPMSTMTEEEYNEVGDLLKAEDPDLKLDEVMATIEIDWLNKKMFDFRGLIPKGLANEVTEENNPYKD